MMQLAARLVVLVTFLALPSSLFAAPVTVIDFESLAEFDSVTTQFAGVTFSNATVLTAGSSLNDLDFPPLSGSNVVFDDGGPMSISFASPVFGFGGYFSYVEPLTLTAYDAANNALGSVTSLFASNVASSGNAGSSPNEFLSLSFLTGISSLTIAGDTFGGSFVLDNATITPIGEPTPVPEPGTLSLMATGVLAVFLRRPRKSPRCG